MHSHSPLEKSSHHIPFDVIRLVCRVHLDLDGTEGAHDQVHPGNIDTPFVKGLADEDVNSSAVRPAEPLGRLGRPNEVAEVRTVSMAS